MTHDAVDCRTVVVGDDVRALSILVQSDHPERAVEADLPSPRGLGIVHGIENETVASGMLGVELVDPAVLLNHGLLEGVLETVVDGFALRAGRERPGIRPEGPRGPLQRVALGHCLRTSGLTELVQVGQGTETRIAEELRRDEALHGVEDECHHLPVALLEVSVLDCRAIPLVEVDGGLGLEVVGLHRDAVGLGRGVHEIEIHRITVVAGPPGDNPVTAVEMSRLLQPRHDDAVANLERSLLLGLVVLVLLRLLLRGRRLVGLPLLLHGVVVLIPPARIDRRDGGGVGHGPSPQSLPLRHRRGSLRQGFHLLLHLEHLVVLLVLVVLPPPRIDEVAHLAGGFVDDLPLFARRPHDAVHKDGEDEGDGRREGGEDRIREREAHR
mmetsp:Transcript_25808/g.76236  ORF Transcript_25808/g.76236 Transcript_25808/m.76236 type:complete len:383 (-) Transcript_25808:133-1281(-)